MNPYKTPSAIKKPSLLSGIGMAILLTLLAYIFEVILSGIFSPWFVLKVTVSLATAIYGMYLLKNFIGQSGVIIFAGLYILFPIMAVLLDIEPSKTIVGALILISLSRGILAYKGLTYIVVDAAFTLLCFILAVIPALEGNTTVLAIWIFFLTQSLFTLIPIKWNRESKNTTNREKDFLRAYRLAKKTIEQIEYDFSIG